MQSYNKLQLPQGNDLPLTATLYRFYTDTFITVPYVEMDELTIYYGQSTLQNAKRFNQVAPFTFTDSTIRFRLNASWISNFGNYSIWLVGKWQGRDVSVNYINWFEVVPQSQEVNTFEFPMTDDVVLPRAVFLPPGLTQDEIDALAREWERRIRTAATEEYVDTAIEELRKYLVAKDNELDAKFSQEITDLDTKFSQEITDLDTKIDALDDSIHEELTKISPEKEVTLDELKFLKSKGELISGCRYKITNYNPVSFDSSLTAIPITDSGIEFIVLTALSSSELSSEGDIVFRVGSPYTKSSWKCLFSLDSDMSHLVTTAHSAQIYKIWDIYGNSFDYDAFSFNLRGSKDANSILQVKTDFASGSIHHVTVKGNGYAPLCLFTADTGDTEVTDFHNTEFLFDGSGTISSIWYIDDLDNSLNIINTKLWINTLGEGILIIHAPLCNNVVATKPITISYGKVVFGELDNVVFDFETDPGNDLVSIPTAKNTTFVGEYNPSRAIVIPENDLNKKLYDFDYNRFWYIHNEGNTFPNDDKTLLKCVFEGKTYVIPGLQELRAPEPPTISPAAGRKDGAFTVTLTPVTDGSTILYRFGSTGDFSEYTKSLEVAQDNTVVSRAVILFAKASKFGETSSVVSTTWQQYRKLSIPVITASGDAYSYTRTVTISAQEGSTIKYRLGASGAEQTYTVPFTVSSSVTVIVTSSLNGWVSSTASKSLILNKPMFYYGLHDSTTITLEQLKALPNTAKNASRVSENNPYSFTTTADGYIWLCTPKNQPITKVTSSGFDVTLADSYLVVGDWFCYRTLERAVKGDNIFVIV